MDNNEFNPSKVTNELNTPAGEYTAAQKAEFSFKADNVNPLKDELNDTTTINDKVEDNLSKKAKQEEDKKKGQNNNTSDSGNINPSISSTSIASSSAAASSGGIVATVAAAATVAVTAVGGLVGLNLVEDESKHEDLITFVSSEITTDSIDVSFSMLSSYLRYEEDPTGAGSDEPLPEKTVVYTIKDGYDFIDEQMVEEGVEIDDQHILYDLHIGELTPNTGYNLTINIKYEYPDKEIPYYKELATRNFQTQAIPTSGDLVEFIGLEASTTDVSFSFKVGKDTVNYDPESQTPPAILMTINGPDSYYEEQYVREVTEYDETSISASGSFFGLSAESEYTITIKFSTESELITLGSTTFVTQKAPTSEFSFYQITPDAKFINVRFYVNTAYIGEDPILIVRAVENGTVVSTAEASFLTTSGTLSVFDAKVENLTPETGYELNVYWEKQDQTTEFLGSDVATTTTFNTTSSGPSVNGILSDYQGTLDSASNTFIMPLSIDFTGTSSSDKFTLEIAPSNASDQRCVATVDASTVYQYAQFTNGSIISSYSGSSFIVKVHDGPEMTGDAIYDTTATITEASMDKVYRAALDYNTTELSSSDTTIDFSMVYIKGDDSHSISFCIIDGNNDRHQFTPIIPATPTDSVLSCDLVSDGNFPSYEGLKQTFDGQQLTILISYYGYGTGTEDIIIAEGITLTFA